MFTISFPVTFAFDIFDLKFALIITHFQCYFTAKFEVSTTRTV